VREQRRHRDAPLADDRRLQVADALLVERRPDRRDDAPEVGVAVGVFRARPLRFDVRGQVLLDGVNSSCASASASMKLPIAGDERNVGCGARLRLVTCRRRWRAAALGCATDVVTSSDAGLGTSSVGGLEVRVAVAGTVICAS
jgi:hypothetical protein